MMNEPKLCPFCAAKAEEYNEYWRVIHKADCFFSHKMQTTILDKECKKDLKQWNSRPIERAMYKLGRKEQATRGEQRVD